MSHGAGSNFSDAAQASSEDGACRENTRDLAVEPSFVGTPSDDKDAPPAVIGGSD
jgi:hypothetical protein